MKSISAPTLLLFTLAAWVVAANAAAQVAPPARGEGALLATADGRITVDHVDATVAPSEPTRGVRSCIDMTDVASWDSLNDSDNIVIDVDISAGFKVVGIAWDVGIATEGESWLADASVLLSDSSGFSDPDGILLAPGTGAERPGDSEFSSNGVVLFESEGLPDVEPGRDGVILLQFFEAFDDFPDAIDAEWRNAAEPVTCPGIWLELAEFEQPGDNPDAPPELDPNAVPLDRPAALALLTLLLIFAGSLALRTRA